MNRRKVIKFTLLSSVAALFSCANSRYNIKELPLEKFKRKKSMVEFKVVGTKIYKDGTEFIVKGANVNGVNWGWPRETTQDAKLIADVWKFNTVRVVNYIEFHKVPPYRYPSFTTNNDLDKIVKVFTDKKIVVMLDAHDTPKAGYYTDSTNPSLSDLKTWWKTLATKHKDNPYVWFNLMNEPGDGGDVSADFLKSHGECIKVIRGICDNIIVVDGNAWAQDVGEWNNSMVKENNSGFLKYGQQLLNYGGKKYENIIFSVHFYDQWNHGDDKMRDYVERVHKKGLCLVAGEYSHSNIGINTMPATRSMFKVLPEKNVGRIVWSWDGGNEKTLTTKAGGAWNIDKTDGSKPTNLNELGNFVWEDNRRKESLSSISKSTSPKPAPAPAPTSPDLVVTELKIQEPLWRKGSTIHFQVTVKNVGDAPTSETWLSSAFYIDGTYADWAAQTASLEVGKTITLTSQGIEAPKSSFELSVSLDEKDRVKEKVEENNTAKMLFE